jgi:hypothetical protein
MDNGLIFPYQLDRAKRPIRKAALGGYTSGAAER